MRSIGHSRNLWLGWERSRELAWNVSMSAKTTGSGLLSESTRRHARRFQYLCLSSQASAMRYSNTLHLTWSSLDRLSARLAAFTSWSLSLLLLMLLGAVALVVAVAFAFAVVTL